MSTCRRKRGLEGEGKKRNLETQETWGDAVQFKAVKNKQPVKDVQHFGDSHPIEHKVNIAESAGSDNSDDSSGFDEDSESGTQSSYDSSEDEVDDPGHISTNTPNLLQKPVNEYEYDSSDEEDIRNTVGNVPMEWYKEYPHIGYDLAGKRIIKPKTADEMDKLIELSENPDYWRTVTDPQTGQNIILSREDIEIIQRIKGGKFADSNVNPYEEWPDFFSREIELHPLSNRPEDKRSFIPSRWERIKVGKMVHAMKMGWMKTPSEREKEKQAAKAEAEKLYDLWNNEASEKDSNRLRLHIPAPKTALPGHAESYNPPQEYLLSEEELRKWNEMDPEDRRSNFVPKKFTSMRLVPAYNRFINERFERCLDLYLCPRQQKMRMDVNPEDLIPKLPQPKDLQPFPTTQSIIYKGHTDLVRKMSADPSGQWFISGSDDKTARIWEVQTGRCMATLEMPGKVRWVSWCPNGSLVLAAIVVDKCLYLVNPLHGDKLIVKHTDEHLQQSVAEKDSGPGSPIADWFEYGADTAEYKRGFRIMVTHSKVVAQVSWHHKGDYLAVTLVDAGHQSVIIHQVTKRRSQCPFSKAKGTVQCTLFHPNKPFLYVATQRYVRIYNLLKQELSKKLQANCKWLSSIAIHPGGDNVITGSYDCRLHWFDLDLSTKPYQTLRHHKKAIRSVDIHKKYPLFASASDDGSVIVCHGMVYNDLMQNPLIVPVKVLRGHATVNSLNVIDCQFHPTQPWLFTSGADGTIRLYS